MTSRPLLRPKCRTRRKEFTYELAEPRKVLTSIFPAYIDGQLNLGDVNSAAPYPLEDTFELETNPGASKTIFLDFNGHFSNNNDWDHSIFFPAWSRDGSTGSFSDAERIEIQRQFQNVAEDFAPFDINVTTKDPGVAALTRSSLFDQNFGVRVVSTQATGGFGNGIGGIAYLRSFNDSIDNPVFVFNKGVNNGAQTISHEVGHALGLSHDGLNSRSYHPGSGSGETSWGPLLGAPFGRNITQWSNGDYAGATQTQDDLAVITSATNGVDYKVDDVGNNIASATAFDRNDDVVFEWGFIERNTDVDYYSFQSDGGIVDLEINAFGENPNLDIRIRVYDTDGNWVLANNHADRVDALIKRALPAGDYYLAIDGVGKSGAYSDYGSLGFYSIEGNISGLSATSASQSKIGEVGNIPDLNHIWKTVQLSQSYTNPVVVAGPATISGVDPVTVRIRNVTSNSFQISIDEWDYRDGGHVQERVDYFVVEAGTHELTDGTILHAGQINSQTEKWSLNSFDGAFEDSAEPPVVVASVTSVNENSAVTTRINKVTNDGFLLKLQEEQAADQVHAGEEVSFIAIERGNGQTGDSDFIVAETGRVVDHRSHRIEFDLHFDTRPSLFAETQTRFGGDTITVRTRNLVRSRTIIFLEEERSADSEIGHTTESVGYFAIPQGDILAAENTGFGFATISTAPPETFRASMESGNGDLSLAQAELESWGEVAYSYGEHDHDHDDENHHYHQHAAISGDDSLGNHGDGCGCPACVPSNDIDVADLNQQNIDFASVDLSRSPFSGFGQLGEIPSAQSDFASADHGSDSQYGDWLDRMRQHQADSFFGNDLLL